MAGGYPVLVVSQDTEENGWKVEWYGAHLGYVKSWPYIGTDPVVWVGTTEGGNAVDVTLTTSKYHSKEQAAQALVETVDQWESRPKRYILMRHDPTGKNHAYLYEYATIRKTLGEGRAAVDIVEIVGNTTEQVEYTARYQLDRLYSGLEGRSNTVYQSPEYAETDAQRVVETLSTL